MKRFALAGNPNCGKTTLFNSLTGSTAHVGNWPGVTVDKRDGVYKKCAEPVAIVDLPGIYSLSPYTPEEVIARNYVLDEKPDCVINIVDATNLERNLYLTTQLLEIDVPVVVALNMMDAVEKAGDKIDAKLLEERLGVPVIKISALKETGLKELMDRAFEESKKPREGVTVLGNTPLAHLIGDVKIALKGQDVDNPLFHAIKLVENDSLEVNMHKDTIGMIEEFKKTFKDDTFGADFEAMVADGRYKYISKNFAPVVSKKNKDKLKMSKSDKADKVLTHKIWGIPIFLVILFAIFHVTFSEDFLYLGAIFKLPSLEDLGVEGVGATIAGIFYDGAVFSPGVILANALNAFTGWLTEIITAGIQTEWVAGLIGDGVLGGLFAVLGFLPQILVLFLCFSILEDTGYMARIAFILDRMFRKFGLSGRAFMPMIMGFGCSLPAMINTRTLADEKERTATVRVIPFFSCGAKLPILTAMAGAVCTMLGTGSAELITYGMYLLGIVSAIVCVLLMRNTTLKGETPPFIMELPTYHRPQFKNLMAHLWDKTKHFIKKAFTVIFASTVIIWLFTHLNWSWQYIPDEQIGESILGSLGKLIQPIFTPLGFGSQLNEFGWVFAVAAITGLIAKENVISTFGTLSAALMTAVSAAVAAGKIPPIPDAVAGIEGIADAVNMVAVTGISTAGVIAFIAFNMTTIPCFAACATAQGELPKGKFHLTVFFWLIASYVVSAIVYTVGSWWWTCFIWLAVIAAVTTIIVLRNKGMLKLKKSKN